MPPNSEAKLRQSSVGIKYPKNRDIPGKSVDLWLRDKRENDGAEGFWRIDDNLYDFRQFVVSHPGGKDWLLFTKGTDITEAFTAHHLSLLPESLLPKYFIRKASSPRNYPYTFKPDGFYSTLKKNVREVIGDIPKATLGQKSNLMTDSVLAATFVTSILASFFWSYMLGILAGYCLCSTVIAAHNYFHRRDNFRMYYFDMSLMSSREWRISHALSHHVYTNTITDIEISMFEPFLQYLPKEKLSVVRFCSWLYSPLVWIFLFHSFIIKRYIKYIIERNFEALRFAELVPFILPTAMYFFGGQLLMHTLWMWTFITLVGSFQLGLIALNAAHHHPDIFHDGDAPRSKEERDWGICQLDAVMDRHDISGNHWLVLTNFGDHGLHHLFPTLDHGVLERLLPVFEKTTKQFGIKLRMVSQLQLVKGQFQQLARVVANPIAKYCNVKKD